jgi:hypothetical protein
MAKVKNPFSSERTILGYSGRGIAAALRVAIPLLTGEQPHPSGVMVRSQIIKANGEPVNVDYMMRRTGDSWLISDIYLDGAISEVATRRSEFATILKSQGIDGLIWSRAARRSKEVGFAMDSPVEEAGFEPSVPRQGTAFFTEGNELYPLPINHQVGDRASGEKRLSWGRRNRCQRLRSLH